MDKIERIRKAFFNLGKSQRDIAEELHHGRNTVAKYVDEGAPVRYTRIVTPARPVLGSVVGHIDRILIDERNSNVPRKQRHTTHTLFVLLRDQYEYKGAEAPLRRYICQQRRALFGPRRLYTPIEHPPTGEAQVDWAEDVLVELGGQEVLVHALCIRLSHSGLPFVMCFHKMKMESFLAGHVHAFLFFGGVPFLLIYDNLKVAVFKVLTGRDRTEQQQFVAFRKHYLFDSRYCMVASPEEKGGVENGVGYYRRNFLTGIPKASDIHALNAMLLGKCKEEADRVQQRRHETIGDAFEKERPNLRTLPRFPFDCCCIRPVLASTHQLVQFDRNRYSVPARYVGRKGLIVKGYADEVVVVHGDEVVARHARLYGAYAESFDPLHYVPQLATKPGLLERGKPFVRWQMPPVLKSYSAQLKERHPVTATRLMVRVLLALENHSMDDVLAAVQLAMESGTCDPDAVLTILEPPQAPVAAVKLDLGDRPDLAVTVPLPDLTRYDQKFLGTPIPMKNEGGHHGTHTVVKGIPQEAPASHNGQGTGEMRSGRGGTGSFVRSVSAQSGGIGGSPAGGKHAAGAPGWCALPGGENAGRL